MVRWPRLYRGGHPNERQRYRFELARLMKVTEAIVAELERQRVADAVADLGFDPMEMARAVIRAADGDVVPFLVHAAIDEVLPISA